MKSPRNVLLILFVVLILLGIATGSFGLEVSDKAPLFNGISTEGKVQLMDYQGKKNVVLALYFAVFSPV